MRICLVSDIHMEFGARFQNATNKLGDGGDALIVAGDLTCSRFFCASSTRRDRAQKEYGHVRRVLDHQVQESILS